MSNAVIIVLLVILAIVISFALLIFILRIDTENKINLTMHKELSDLSNIPLIERYNDAVEYLDKIVSDSVEEYKVQNPNLEREYITEESEIIIRKKIMETAVLKIGPLCWHRLEQVFKDPSNIVATKIYLAVTLYVINSNEDVSD